MSEDVAGELRALLAARGAAWPAPVEHVESAASTNDLVKQRARAGAPEWSTVLAGRQTAGRGRQGSDWLSPAGNLFLSVLLRPVALPADRAGLLPLAVGVVVHEAVSEWGIAAELKWPNDVLVSGRKLGGILVESSSSGGGLDTAVVGIGLNLGLDPSRVAPDLQGRLTSVWAETGRAVTPVEAAAAVLARLPRWYDPLVARPDEVAAAWRLRSAPWWGQRVEVVAGEAALSGVARGIDEGGALVLDADDGRRLKLLAGEVRRLRPRT